MIKIDGLEKLQRTLKEAQEVLKKLDGELVNLPFDANDPVSVEGAISQMEQAIDARTAGYRDNDFVCKLIANAKEHCRQYILDKASEARSKAGSL